MEYPSFKAEFPCRQEGLSPKDRSTLSLAGRLTMIAMEESSTGTLSDAWRSAAESAERWVERAPGSDTMRAVRDLVSGPEPDPRVLRCAVYQTAKVCLGSACGWWLTSSLD